MFALVNRTLVRRLAFVLITAQLLFAPPVTSAFAAMAAAGSHCGDVMPGPDEQATGAQGAVDQDATEPCACCPDRGMSTAACLSACSASLGLLPVFEFPVSPADTMPARRDASIPHVLLADPPLHPPPIG